MRAWMGIINLSLEQGIYMIVWILIPGVSRDTPFSARKSRPVCRRSRP
jgi:hypothetical protein